MPMIIDKIRTHNAIKSQSSIDCVLLVEPAGVEPASC